MYEVKRAAEFNLDARSLPLSRVLNQLGKKGSSFPLQRPPAMPCRAAVSSQFPSYLWQLEATPPLRPVNIFGQRSAPPPSMLPGAATAVARASPSFLPYLRGQISLLSRGKFLSIDDDGHTGARGGRTHEGVREGDRQRVGNSENGGSRPRRTPSPTLHTARSD